MAFVLCFTMCVPFASGRPMEPGSSAGPSDQDDSLTQTLPTQSGDPVAGEGSTGIAQTSQDGGMADQAPGTAAQSSDKTLVAQGFTGMTAEQIVDSWSVQQQVEQLVMPAFRTWEGSNLTTLNSSLAANLAAHNYAGIILFGENFSTTAQAVTLVDAMTTANQSDPLSKNAPLLIGTDQEGGIVTRTTGTGMPGNMALAATGNIDNATAAGSLTGDELKALGINVDFAPSLDTNSNPANPVIGVRAFSDDPDMVARYGTAFINGLHSQGIAASVKHFPGHGDTATDSHTGLPLVDKSYDQLRACELIPFSAGISTGADLVMTAHIQFPQIETGTYTSIKPGHEQIHIPATLSKTILTDILRGDLGFDGVIVTDSMGMGAIQENFDPTDAAVMAINAGVDILLMPISVTDDASLASLQTYIANIVANVGDTVSGARISSSAVRDAAVHVVQMKIDRGIITDTPDTRTLTQKIAEAEGTVGSAEHHATERQISADAVTVISNVDHTLPLTPKAGEHVVLVASYDVKMDALKFGFERLQREGLIAQGVTYEVVTYDDGLAGSMDGVRNAVGRADCVVCMSQVYEAGDLMPASTISGSVDQIIEAAHAKGIPIVIMSCGLPYDAARYPSADGMVLTYGSRSLVLDASGTPTGTYGPNIPAGLDLVFGKNLTPVGSLPVNVYKLDLSNVSNIFTDEVLYARGYGIHSLPRKGLPVAGDVLGTLLPFAAATFIALVLGVTGACLSLQRARRGCTNDSRLSH